MELSQLVEHALATKDMIHTPKRAGTLPELPVNNKTPTFPQEISRPYSLRHSAAYAVSDGKDLDLEALRIKVFIASFFAVADETDQLLNHSKTQ